MARKIKQRTRFAIGAGSASGTATVNAYSWTIAETPPTQLGPFTEGQAYQVDLKAQYTNLGSNTDYVFSLDSVTPLTQEVGLTTDGVLSISENTPADSYSVIVNLAEATAGTAEADWLYRSGQDPANPYRDGVVWAHDFRNAEEVTNFIDSASALYYTRVADGPTGYCLNVEIPAAGPYSIVTDITRASPAVVTTNQPHGFQTGNRVSLWSLPSPFNALSPNFGQWGYIVTVLSPTTFELYSGNPSTLGNPINTSAYGSTYNAASPGRCVKHIISQGAWRRPFAPLSSGNGLGVPDINLPGKTTSAWSPAEQYRYESMQNGFYGHSSYHSTGAAYTYGGGLSFTPSVNNWHGTEYYVQFRVKMPYARFWAVDQPGGKLAFLDTTMNPGGVCEIVPTSEGHWRMAEGPTWDAARTYWPASVTHPLLQSWYTGGSRALGISSDTFSPTVNAGVPDRRMQPGDEPYRSTCRTTLSLNDASCLWMPADEWVTYLMRVKLGRDNRQAESTYNYTDTTIEIWVHFQNEPGVYRKLYSVTDGRWSANGATGAAIPAHNCLTFSGYMNEVPAATGWYHRYAQVIFSTQFIPAPNV